METRLLFNAVTRQSCLRNSPQICSRRLCHAATSNVRLRTTSPTTRHALSPIHFRASQRQHLNTFHRPLISLLRRRDASQPHQTHRAASTYRDGTGSFAGNAKVLFREYPFSMSLATFIIFFGASYLVYVNYYYQEFIIKQYQNYPEEVAKKLRRASHFTINDFQPKEAIKYYRQAIEVANELGMDPYSEEVQGIKIRVAEVLELCHQLNKAVEVLERLNVDNQRWLNEWRDHPEFHNKSEWRKKRTQILKKTIAINVKLGELYADGAVWDKELALARMVWAVEAALKESARRTADSATEETDGKWLEADEMGAALESLAERYEDKNMNYLATPLLIQALSLKETSDCHSVILMNNIASALAQQSPTAARAAQAYAESNSISTANAPSGPVADRETFVENAKVWAEKALSLGRSIKPPDRTEECDIGCAVATHNLATFAETLGDSATAQKRYKEAISLSRAIGFEEGVENSSARLRALQANTG